MRTFTRAGLALLSLFAMTLIGEWLYQRIAERRDDDRYPPSGELHSVDGRVMHIRCRGSVSSTIIVEQGIGGPSVDWNDITRG